MIDILHACHLLVQTCNLYLWSNLGLRFFLQALLERTVSGVALDVAVQPRIPLLTHLSIYNWGPYDGGSKVQ